MRLNTKPINNAMIVHCKTQEEANTLCALCNVVRDDRKLADYWRGLWTVYDCNTCYRVYAGNITSYGHLNRFNCIGSEEIIELSDIILSKDEFEKPDEAEELLRTCTEICNDSLNNCLACRLGYENCPFLNEKSDKRKIVEICTQWTDDFNELTERELYEYDDF